MPFVDIIAAFVI